MTKDFSEIKKIYGEAVDKISSYPSKEREDEYIENCEIFLNLLRNKDRVIWIGTGRQEEIASFATMLTKANDKDTACSNDSSIPYEFSPNDVIVALSSSGETGRTIHYAESAYNPIADSAPVIAITTDPDSTLAKIAEKTGGFVVQIPGRSKADNTEYQERQFMGKHEPLNLGGTLGELHALEFILDSLGSSLTHTSIMEYHRNFWEKVRDYDPEPEQFEKFHDLLPEPIDYSSKREVCGFPNKVTVGGLGLSGIIARAFSIRLAHCAGENQERRVNFYKDAGNIVGRSGDLSIIVSGSGQTFWREALEPIKKVGGKIASITSFEDSPLGKISDVTIKVPGRQGDREQDRLENPPRTPDRALFEIRSFLALEAFIHILVEKEEISIKAVEGKHSQLT